jgi:hypothetical protein
LVAPAVVVPAVLPPALAPAVEEPAVPAAFVPVGGPSSEEEQAKTAPQHAATKRAETDGIEEVATAIA